MGVVQKLYNMAKEFDQAAGVGVLTGFVKVNDVGSQMKHSSNGVMAQIQPWLHSDSNVNDSSQPYMRFFPNRNPVQWHDGGNSVDYHKCAICESD